MNGYPNNIKHYGFNGNARFSNSSSRDFLAPGTDVIVTRTLSPTFNSPDSTFRKDEIVRIMGPTQDPSWFRARNSNQEEGLVHVDYICGSGNSMSSIDAARFSHSSNDQRLGPVANVGAMPWFHSNISRETTEGLLTHKADGTFLVRESTNFPGDYTLSMSFRGKVEHYRIYQSSGQLTCDNEEFFPNLLQLVSHYKRDADGLCHRLVTPVICEHFRAQAPSDFEDKTAAFKIAGVIISPNEIKLGDSIGHGEFGDVVLGLYKEKKVAVKVSKRNSGNMMIDSLLDEAKFMIGLTHQSLVALVGVVLDDVNVYMVTEYMANGNLVDFLRSRGRHQLEKSQLVQFAVDICEGMCFLESRLIVHRDLAARNILLDDNLAAKISDFGLAKKAHTASQDNASGKFPIKWTAPEALRHSNFSSRSDMWSFGVLLWEIFSFGRVPYPRIPIQDVVRHIERGYRMEAPEGCPAEIVRLMNEAWALNPNERPSFEQALQRLINISRAGI